MTKSFLPSPSRFIWLGYRYCIFHSPQTYPLKWCIIQSILTDKEITFFNMADRANRRISVPTPLPLGPFFCPACCAHQNATYTEVEKYKLLPCLCSGLRPLEITLLWACQYEINLSPFKTSERRLVLSSDDPVQVP